MTSFQVVIKHSMGMRDSKCFVFLLKEKIFLLKGEFSLSWHRSLLACWSFSQVFSSVLGSSATQFSQVTCLGTNCSVFWVWRLSRLCRPVATTPLFSLCFSPVIPSPWLEGAESKGKNQCESLWLLLGVRSFSYESRLKLTDEGEMDSWIVFTQPLSVSNYQRL